MLPIDYPWILGSTKPDPSPYIFMPGKPDAEIEITPELVRELVAGQFPKLADESIVEQTSGWDNVIYRLGLQYLVRLPRRALGGKHAIHEQEFLPKLAPVLPLPIPSPVAIGQPTKDYPWHWSIVQRFRGETLDLAELVPGQAAKFGTFLKTLHRQDPSGVPDNPYRGGFLHDRIPWFEERWDRLTDAGEPSASEGYLRFIQEALATPYPDQTHLLHGDLHPWNLLAADGKLTAVLDWGDLTEGDIATDIASAWLLFDEPAERAAFFSTYQVPDEATLRRARGWAVTLAAVFLDTGLTNGVPGATQVGRDTLRRLTEDL